VPTCLRRRRPQACTSPALRLLGWLATSLMGLAALAPPALGHAVLTSSTPAANARVASAPSAVALRFSEPVQLIAGQDIEVLDGRGAPVTAGRPATEPQDARVVSQPLSPELPQGTYTVGFTVLSADAHVIEGTFVFGVGDGPLAPALAGGAGPRQGPSETSAWAVSARYLELLALGGLLGLIAFRWLVWRPVMRLRMSAGLAPSIVIAARPPDDERAALALGRDLFWATFGTLAIASVLAEGYLLVVKSASALGVSVWGALSDPAGVSRVLASGRFGDLVQLRTALLAGLFAVGVWQFLAEHGERGAPRQPAPAGRLAPTVLMAALALAALGSISYQGHASTAPLSALSIAADALHLGAASIWIAGLALLGVILVRLPRVAPVGGPGLAAATLARFSRLALVAVTVIVATGVGRSLGELSDPAQLWETAFGRSIIFKLLLLCSIAFLALRNRRVLAALRGVRRPGPRTLRMVRRGAALELALALGVVLVASILVAQVPGRVVADAASQAGRDPAATPSAARPAPVSLLPPPAPRPARAP
jgi:copper transport protein